MEKKMTLIELLKTRKETLVSFKGKSALQEFQIRKIFRDVILKSLHLQGIVKKLVRVRNWTKWLKEASFGIYRDTDYDYDGWTSLHYRVFGPIRIYCGRSSYYNGIDGGFTQDDMMLSSSRSEEKYTIREALKMGFHFELNNFLFGKGE